MTNLLNGPDSIKTNDIDRLRTEYQTLVERLHDNRLNRQTDVVMSNPILPDDILQEAVPGNIRKAEHFVAFLRRFVEYLKVCVPHDPLIAVDSSRLC